MRYAPHKFVNPRDRVEMRDCVVRAICTAAQIPYAQAHEACRAAGRKTCHRFFTRKGLAKAKEIGLLDYYRVVPPFDGTYSLSRVLRMYSCGHYVIESRNHAMALIDGVIHDKASRGPGLNTKIEGVWRIK